MGAHKNRLTKAIEISVIAVPTSQFSEFTIIMQR